METDDRPEGPPVINSPPPLVRNYYVEICFFAALAGYHATQLLFSHPLLVVGFANLLLLVSLFSAPSSYGSGVRVATKVAFGFELAFNLMMYMVHGVEAYPVNTVHHLERRGNESPSNRIFLNNSIALGVPVLFSFVIRLINKMHLVKEWKAEDWIMAAVIMPVYFALIILINVSARYATNLYPADQEADILSHPNNVADRILGSKIVIGLEQSMLLVTWGVKACLWIFMTRLCQIGAPDLTKALWWLFAWCVFGYTTIQVTYYGLVCQPFSQYWAVPVQNPQCATYQYYSIVQMIFNISSDIVLFTIPLVLVLRSKCKKRKKATLVPCFLLGALTIGMAIANKFYNFASPWTTVYALWYIREASTAIFVCNLVCSWKLIKMVLHLEEIVMTVGRNSMVLQPRNIELPPRLRKAVDAVVVPAGKVARSATGRAYALYDDVMLTTIAGRSGTQSGTASHTDVTAQSSVMTSMTDPKASLALTTAGEYTSEEKRKALGLAGLDAPTPSPTIANDEDPLVSRLSKSETSVPAVGDDGGYDADESDRDRRKASTKRKAIPGGVEPVTLISIDRDGDDAGPALQFRKDEKLD